MLLLLTGVVFVMGLIQTFFAPERTRALLSGRRLSLGNVMAATLGIVTPFCSCSAVPLFIGFVSAGVTFSFLIAAPMINEIALALLLGLFGWQVALLYLRLGLGVAIGAGLVIGRLGMERYLEDWVRAIHLGETAAPSQVILTWPQRLGMGLKHLREILGRVWPYIFPGIGLGAFIHGYVPEDRLADILGQEVWWVAPVAVLLGIPLYTNAAGIIPIIDGADRQGGRLGHDPGLYDERDRALRP
ncbi:permease [Caldichromatium japonicum]|uniref:permease n=1 Tax=Caldichromatium japonicum TaxID=2699430 RepID=UPI0031B5C7FF